MPSRRSARWSSSSSRATSRSVAPRRKLFAAWCLRSVVRPYRVIRSAASTAVDIPAALGEPVGDLGAVLDEPQIRNVGCRRRRPRRPLRASGAPVRGGWPGSRGSKNPAPNDSTPTRLPRALSSAMRSNSRSWASAGRYGSSPSAAHAVGSVASKPASRNAFGQSLAQVDGHGHITESRARRHGRAASRS